MKKNLALIAPVLLIGASSVMADDCGFTPYVGLDAQLRHTGFKNRFGGNLFNPNYPQGNVYVGLKFNNIIGIEIGFSGGPRRTRSATLHTGDLDLGTPLIGEFAAATPIVYNTTTKISSFHADLVGFLPITCDTQAYALVGYARVRPRFTRTLIAAGPQGTSFVGDPDFPPVKFSKTRDIVRLGIGLQQMLTCNVGVRAGLIWENTSKLRNITGQTNLLSAAGPQPLVKLKDSFNYSLGLFWQF